jgi:DNA mismatch repair protein MutS
MALAQTSPAVATGVFVSLLDADRDAADDAAEPPFFADLNLGSLVSGLVERRKREDLAHFFWTPAPTIDAARYRQEVFRDLQDEPILHALDRYAQQLADMRRWRKLSTDAWSEHERQMLAFEAVRRYLAAVRELRDSLSSTTPASRALRSLGSWLDLHVESAGHRALRESADTLQARLSGIDYRVRILGDRVYVGYPKDEIAYTPEIDATFERFRHGEVDDHRMKVPRGPGLDHVEAQILSLVARLYPAEFRALAAFLDRWSDFAAPTLMRLDREAHFFLAFHDLTERHRQAGVAYCLPELVDAGAPLRAVDLVDIALADKRVGGGGRVVPNDVELSGAERVLVVTGPNQGGKTTFARSVAQLAYLARLGVPVPARRATVPFVDSIFTLFERGENLDDLRGKLNDELERVREVLEVASPSSLIVLNEVFTSTSLDDAVVLSSQVLRRVIELGAVVVCVTFLDELTTLSESTVSMVAAVDAADRTTRTFKVVRRRADGASYAAALRDKYGLAFATLTAVEPS